VPSESPTAEKQQRHVRARSRVTNGVSLFADRTVDQRSKWARRFVDLFGLHTEDLGGVDRLSEAQKSLVRRAASLEVELEKQESALAQGETVDIDAYGRAANTLRRLLEVLGIEKKAKTVEVTLADIIRQHRPEPTGAPKAHAAISVPPTPETRTQTPFPRTGDGGDGDEDRDDALEAAE
jgi:hypothetical protein